MRRPAPSICRAVVSVCLGLTLAVLAPATSTAAEPTVIEYDAFQLAAGRIQIRSALDKLPVSDAAVTASGEGCTVGVTDGAIVPDSDGCAALWARKTLRQVDLTVSRAGESVAIRLVPRRPDVAAISKAFFLRGATLDVGKAVGADRRLAVFDGRWRLLAAGAELSAEEADRWRKHLPGAAWSTHDGKREGYFRWMVYSAEPSRTTPSVPAGGTADPEFCRAHRSESTRYVICFDMATATPRVELPAVGPIVRPNTPFLVAVRHHGSLSAAITLGGKQGIYTPGVKADGLRGAAPVDAFVQTVQEFAPRLPGNVDVSVELRSNGELVSRGHTEVIVEPTYRGAVRLGLAGVAGPDVDPEYYRVLHSGAGQEEIASVGAPDFDVELVLGFALFLDSGGRGYTKSSLARFAPYFGLGVASLAGDGGLEVLKSIHVGFEWEPVEVFSVAVTGVVRRVQRLPDGVPIGAPVDGNIPLELGASFGVGIVLNFSPEFFKIGAPQVMGLL